VAAIPPAGAGPGPDGTVPELAVLLATKLTAPALRPQLIGRAALIQVLCAGDGRKLTLLDAPAGWGKTTLLAQWIARERERHDVAWLSLDLADNDPARFWTYAVTAMQKACPGLDTRAVELIGVHANLEQVVLPTLLNELASLDDGIVLVLDDYHVVTNRTIQEEMAFFIERMPANLRLVIATRSDPPLPLARLRAGGHLLEIRADDLRFAAGEASRMLNDVLGLSLAAADIELLCQRTEGWAAGLYLAALSLGGRSDADSYIKAFAGDDRHIVDYLSAEVLDGQPPAIRLFLLRTAVLERLSGPLCDATLETSGSTGTLQQIERDNLFLVPLDSSRHWYRYHHLFGGLLRNELRRAEPALIPRLHERAAAWFRAEGLTDEAVRHLIAAGDVAGGAELIAECWGAEFNRGWLSTVSAWLDLLPEQTVRSNPRLCLAQAWIALDMRQLPDAARWVEAAQAGLADYLASPGRAAAEPDLAGPCGIFRADTLEAEIAVLRAVQVFKIGNVGRAVDVAEQAAQSDLGDVPLGPSAAYCVYGAALYWSGRTRRARTAFSRAVQLSDAAGNLLGRTYSLGYLALIAAERGQLAEAGKLIDQAAEGARDATAGEHFVDMMPALAMAKVLDRRGATAQAAEAADRAVVLSLRGGGNLEVANALLVRSGILRQLDEPEAAQSSVAEASAVLRDCPDPGLAGELLAAAEGRRPASDAQPAATDVPGPAALPEQLTSKELELLRLLPTPLTRREIGARLFVSVNTVKTHQRGLYRKLGVTGRAEAVHRARDLGLLTGHRTSPG
jgi:LuxR family transcriptional regulator, maltose regulon positive regulatory protein